MRLSLVLVLALSAISCGWRKAPESSAATREAVARAHAAYVTAINANKVDSWVGTLSDDVVFLVPNRPAVVGKAAVGDWISTYLREVTTHWTKEVQDFTVAGDWAFGRYVYTASDNVIIRDPETDGGGTANDSGWGFIVYHHDGDGTWRVARDAWGSDRPAR